MRKNVQRQLAAATRRASERHPRRFSLHILLLSLSCCLGFSQSNEPQIKAAMLFNFAQFVEWPTNALSGPTEPFVIGLIGAGAVQLALEEITRGETVRGHPIEIRAIRSAAQAAQTQILYFGGAEGWRWPDFRRAVSDRPVLTVSDAADFARMGGMLELYKKENKIRFRANVAEAKRASLILSSKLLRLAEIVETVAD